MLYPRLLVVILALMASGLGTGCASIDRRASVTVVVYSDDRALAIRIAQAMRAKGYRLVAIHDQPLAELAVIDARAPASAVVDARIAASKVLGIPPTSFRVVPGANPRFTNLVAISAPSQDLQARAMMRSKDANTEKRASPSRLNQALPSASAKPSKPRSAPEARASTPRVAKKAKPKPAPKPKVTPPPERSERASRTGTFQNLPPGPPID